MGPVGLEQRKSPAAVHRQRGAAGTVTAANAPAGGTPAPDLFPNWDGGVQAAWEYGGTYLEVEFCPGQEARWAFVDERRGDSAKEDMALDGDRERFEARVRAIMRAARE